MSNQPFVYIFILLGGLQGLFLGLIHAFRRTSFRWTQWLGWALATHALSDIFLWLFWTRNDFGWRLFMLLPLNVVLVPVYFLFNYLRAYTGNERVYQKYTLFLGFMAALEVIIYLLPAGAALYQGVIDASVLSFAKSIRQVLTVGSLPIVLGACLLLYQLVHNNLLADRTWPYQLMIWLCLIYGLAQLPLLVNLLSGWQSRVLFYPLGVGSTLFLVWAGIRAFVVHEPGRLTNRLESTSINEAGTPQSALYMQTIQLIEQEKLFRLPALKLTDIASRLNVSPHYLSRVVNQQAQKNFNDLINEYRVMEVKRLMADPSFSHYTLEALGREAGFAAKSTYQAAFKKITGITPSQYRNTHRLIS
jgi:AraC-like DNA-binding protein